MDLPPQTSRSSFSDPTTPTQGPVPLFDVHLRYLTDSYLSFFQERYFTLLTISFNSIIHYRSLLPSRKRIEET
jgi:hypothetical protein